MTDKTTIACIAIAISAVTAGAIGNRLNTQATATNRLVHRVVVPKTTATPAAPATAQAALPSREIDCLASAIWYEAGNQPREGKIAVAEVVMTRTRMPQQTKRPCGVLRQKNQFSFVHHGIIPAVPEEVADDVRRIARGVAAGALRSRVRGAVFFHALYVKPNWRYRLRGTIGMHAFYDLPHTLSG